MFEIKLERCVGTWSRDSFFLSIPAPARIGLEPCDSSDYDKSAGDFWPEAVRNTFSL